MKTITQSKAEEIIKIINETESDDENITRLEKATEYFCGNYDICEGYKHALNLTLEDQMNNHIEDLEIADLNKLLDILNGAI